MIDGLWERDATEMAWTVQVVASASEACAVHVHDPHLRVVDAFVGKVPISGADQLVVNVYHCHSAHLVRAQNTEPDLHGIFGWTLSRRKVYAASTWHLDLYLIIKL
jgi:hypothetical protein